MKLFSKNQLIKKKFSQTNSHLSFEGCQPKSHQHKTTQKNYKNEILGCSKKNYLNLRQFVSTGNTSVKNIQLNFCRFHPNFLPSELNPSRNILTQNNIFLKINC